MRGLQDPVHGWECFEINILERLRAEVRGEGEIGDQVDELETAFRCEIRTLTRRRAHSRKRGDGNGREDEERVKPPVSQTAYAHGTGKTEDEAQWEI